MSKIIRLTEEDLVRLVKKVISEQNVAVAKGLSGIKIGDDVQITNGNTYSGSVMLSPPFGFSGTVTKIDSKGVVIKGRGNKASENKEGCVIIKPNLVFDEVSKQGNMYFITIKAFYPSLIDSFYCK